MFFCRFPEGATTSASTFDVPGTLVGVFADDTKQPTGRNRFYRLHSALQQRVMEYAAWFVHSREEMKLKRRLTNCGFLQSAMAAGLMKMLRVSFCNLVVVSTTHCRSSYQLRGCSTGIV